MPFQHEICRHQHLSNQSYSRRTGTFPLANPYIETRKMWTGSFEVKYRLGEDGASHRSRLLCHPAQICRRIGFFYTRSSTKANTLAFTADSVSSGSPRWLRSSSLAGTTPKPRGWIRASCNHLSVSLPAPVDEYVAAASPSSFQGHISQHANWSRGYWTNWRELPRQLRILRLFLPNNNYISGKTK